VGVRLGVLTPTYGRPTLRDALATTEGADVRVVAWDTDAEPPSWLDCVVVRTPGPRGSAPRADGGAWARGHALREVGDTADVWAFADDDDVWLPGTVELRRAWADARPDALHIGRYIGDDGVTVGGWTERVIQRGIGHPVMVAPGPELVALARSDAWPVCYEADLMIARALAAMGVPVEWHEEPVLRVRPWGRV